MSRLKWAFVAAVMMVGVLGGVGMAQEAIKVTQPASKVYDKDVLKDKGAKVPAEIKIPDPRADKVLLLQEQARNVELEQQALVEKFKASDQWRALEARQKAVADKLVAELTSALKMAGVEEKDFGRYKYDQSTLKLTLQPAETPKAESPKP